MNTSLGPDLQARTILIAEDNPANLAVLEAHLEKHGFVVVVAQDGEEAFDRAKYVRPDIILLDVMMPGIDGFETCRRLKALERTKDIPVIFMTALTDIKAKMTGFEAGAVDYVTKPLQAEEVLARVKAHVNLRTTQRRLKAQNLQLQREIAERQRVEAALQASRDELERRVAQRTAELAGANARLKEEIGVRKRAEEEVRRLNAELEARIVERTSQLVTANQELEAFNYSVSHDLRAPLRSIGGFGSLLLEQYTQSLDATGVDYLRRICASSERMGGLIDDMLKLARLARGEMQRRRIDLSELVGTIVEQLRQEQPERQVEVTIAPELYATADANFIGIALENLLENAWKFTGKVTPARIEFGALGKETDPIYFVRDNGAGFDMHYAEKLFAPFQRLHNTIEFEGTGVGLATVQRVISRHGGRVWAGSAVDQGTTVYFTLGAAT